MRDIIREKKFNNTVVGLELKCFESAHLVVSALQQLRPPSVPLACDLQIILHRDTIVSELRLLFVFVGLLGKTSCVLMQVETKCIN